MTGRARMELEDSKGNLWFATDGAGAFKSDGTCFTQFTESDGLCSNTVWRMTTATSGSHAYRPANL